MKGSGIAKRPLADSTNAGGKPAPKGTTQHTRKHAHDDVVLARVNDAKGKKLPKLERKKNLQKFVLSNVKPVAMPVREEFVRVRGRPLHPSNGN